MKILLLYGHGCQPGGTKFKFLFRHGHDVIIPAFPGKDFKDSVRFAQQAFDELYVNVVRDFDVVVHSSRSGDELYFDVVRDFDVVVGSSRGGAVAMNLATGKVPLVLIAPAWKQWGTATTVKKAVTILHSPNDDVVPIGDSRELLRNSGLSEDHLLVVGANHDMEDEQALEALLKAVEESRNV